MSRPRLPKPEGFDAFAEDHAGDEIARHFKISRERTNRHLREMPLEWRKARTKVLQIRAGRCSVAAAVKAAKLANTKPIPDDFVEVLMSGSRLAASRHFNMPTSTLYAMFKRLPAETQAAISAAGQERKRAASARNALKAAAASKRAKTPGKASGVNWGFNKPTSIAPPRFGLDEDAARFLRRHYRNVCRGETVSRALAGLWLVGTMPAQTADDMMALASRRGWRAGDFLRVAA